MTSSCRLCKKPPGGFKNGALGDKNMLVRHGGFSGCDGVSFPRAGFKTDVRVRHRPYVVSNCLQSDLIIVKLLRREIKSK